MRDSYRKIVLLAGDICVMYLALAVALLVRGGFPSSGAAEGGLPAAAILATTWNQHLWSFTLLQAIWALILYVDGFYSLARLRLNTAFLQGLIRVVLFCGLAGVLFFYVFNAFGITPKTVLALHVGFFAVLFVAWRWLAGGVFRFSGLRQPIVLLETDGETASLASALTDDPYGPYRVVGVCDLAANGGEVVCRLAREKAAETVVVGDRAWQSLPPELYDLALGGVRVVDATTFREENDRRVPLGGSADLAWFLAGFRHSLKPDYEAAKRVTDVVFASMLGAALSPFLLLIAVGVKLSGGPGPVFFIQRRVGRFGRKFDVIKFRTMSADAEAAGGPQWSSGHNDPRVFPFGRFLRHTHLDETPQLWNIIRGEMSFVGPRPERPVFVEKLKAELPFYGLRHLVRPGITGWAQVNFRYGSSVGDAAEKLAWDLWYVKNRGAAVDLKIILKTAAMVFRGEGC